MRPRRILSVQPGPYTPSPGSRTWGRSDGAGGYCTPGGFSSGITTGGLQGKYGQVVPVFFGNGAVPFGADVGLSLECVRLLEKAEKMKKSIFPWVRKNADQVAQQAAVACGQVAEAQVVIKKRQQEAAAEEKQRSGAGYYRPPTSPPPTNSNGGGMPTWLPGAAALTIAVIGGAYYLSR